MRSAILAALLALPVVAPAQDAATVQLQQEVLELKRVNMLLEQRVTALERQVSAQSGLAVPMIAPSGSVGLTGAGAAAAAGGVGRSSLAGLPPAAQLPWMDSANWDRIKAGMPEMEVIRILGVPNSLRDANPGRQVIFYALEIGTGRFLSGSVTLSEHRVVDVQKPLLK